MNTHIVIHKFGGGVGATTLALVIGKRLATPLNNVVVIADSLDIYPLGGVPANATHSEYTPNLRLHGLRVMSTKNDPFYDYERDMDTAHRSCRYTVCEGIEPPKGFNVAIRFGIVRNDYISLQKAVTQHDPKYPVTHWIVRDQDNRALTVNDCRRTLPGAHTENIIVSRDNPALARMCDAGLMLYKPFIDRVSDAIMDHIKESEVSYA